MVIERGQILGLFEEASARSPQSTLFKSCREGTRILVYEADGKLVAEPTKGSARMLEPFFAEVEGPSR